MAGVNKVILVGNVCADVEARTPTGSSPVANFTVATNESYKNKQGEKVDTTEFHKVVLWGRLAEIADKYIKKGGQVYIEGKLTTRSWDDQEGNKRYTTEVVGRELTLLGKAEGSGNQAPAPSGNDEQDWLNDGSDDLPF